MEWMTRDERALLELLAAVDDGATDALLVASGFGRDVIVGLLRRGLVTSQLAVGEPVACVGITQGGQRALAERQG
jgi:hypothetical protein